MRRSKYGNIRTMVDGIAFDSKAEARRYKELRLLEMAGHIESLVLQPRYLLQAGFTDADGCKVRKMEYVGDFGYHIGTMNVVEDVKGRETAAFRLKAKLFRQRYPNIKFLIVRGF